VVKTPRHRGTNRPGPPLENAAHKAKDAPSLRTRLSCVWRGLLFATTLEVVRAEQASTRKLGFGSLGGLDDPSWDAQNSDFGPKSVSGHPDEPPAQSPPRERRCRGKEIASTAMQPHRIPGSARPDRPPPACNRT
jgi:hypothetical protein